ncbi:MAG: hypothetical protein N0A24_03370 [Armatimonadetes bacterium]|nr:hypothetical protein [Armatimonadota bacterium]MDW8153251.1 hypothetical protein [Armatimonadota bacterium]
MADVRALWLGLAFLSISGFFLVHALATPHVLVGPNATVGRAARLSLFGGALTFALSAVPWGSTWSARLPRSRRVVLALFGVGILAFGAGPLLAELRPWLATPMQLRRRTGATGCPTPPRPPLARGSISWAVSWSCCSGPPRGGTTGTTGPRGYLPTGPSQ